MNFSTKYHKSVTPRTEYLKISFHSPTSFFFSKNIFLTLVTYREDSFHSVDALNILLLSFFFFFLDRIQWKIYTYFETNFQWNEHRFLCYIRNRCSLRLPVLSIRVSLRCVREREREITFSIILIHCICLMVKITIY